MKLDLSATQKQLEFITADADEVLYGGAAGGGKSHGQLVDALLYALRYPKSKQLVLRRTYPELKRSLVRAAFTLFPREVARYNNTDHRWDIVNGSVIEFGYCAAAGDETRYQSAEYDVIRFDELTHFTEYQYVYLLSRLRGTSEVPRSVKSTANPGGIGHEWVKRRFITPRPPGVAGEDATGRKLLYIPAKVQDNPFLMRHDPGYLKRLEALPERQRKALLDGDWNIFEGQYFDEWDEQLHVVKPFPLPAHWRRYRCLDYGFDLLAALWIAVDESGRAVVYREHCSGMDGATFNAGGTVICGERALLASEAAKAILAHTPSTEHITATLAPPDLWNRHNDTGESTADIFGAQGLFLSRADNRRDQGWMALREWLKPTTDEQNRQTARIRVFQNCRVLIDSIPKLQTNPDNPGDCATEPHEYTHAPDALRYFVAGRPLPAEALPQDDPFAPEADDIEGFIAYGTR